LIAFANESGGSDNISVALVSVGEEVTGLQLEDDKTAIDVGLDLLASNPLFSEVTYADRLKIMPLTNMVQIEGGSFLIHEGDAPDNLYIVQTGSLAVYRGEELIAKLRVGDYVGEMGVFDGEPSSASVVALESTQCMVIGRTQLLNLLRQEPTIGFKIQNSLIRVLCRRLRSTSKDLAWTRREFRRNTQEFTLPEIP
jgi:CRP-like cAMP-binding protein